MPHVPARTSRGPALCCAAALAGIAVGGCSGKAPGGWFGRPTRAMSGQVLVFGNGAEPEHLDPGLGSESSGNEIGRNLWEGLAAYHPQTLEPVPGVAQAWDISPDGTTYTFHLRRNARWSNGEPVTAHDFHWSWIRVLTPETISQYATLMYFIVGGRDFFLRRLLVVGDGGAPLTETSDPTSAGAGALRAGDFAKILYCDKASVAGPAPRLLPAPLPAVEGRLIRTSADAPPVRLELSGGPGGTAALPLEGAPSTDGPAAPAVTVLRWTADAVRMAGADAHWVEVRDAAGRTGWILTAFLTEAEDARRCHVRWERQDYAPEHVRDAPPAPGDVAPAVPLGWVDRDRLRIDDRVVGIEVPDDYTLRVHLDHPVPFFLELTAWITFSPAHRASVEKHGDDWTRPEHIVCNGPFVLTDWRIQYQLVLEPNPHYWDRERVRLDKVVALSIDSNNAVVNLYEAGEIDWTGPGTALPSEYADFLETKDDHVFAPHLGSYYYWVNVKARPVDQAKVRRALAMSIDRAKITEYITRAGQVPASHLVPAGLGGYVPAEGPPFDPAAAQALLAEAGYPGGKGLAPIELIYNTSEGHRKIAEAVQQMWKDNLGIDVAISNQEWKVFLGNLQYGFYQVARMGWIGDYRDPYTFLELLQTESGHNYGQYSNPEYDRLVGAALRETDTPKRLAMYREAEAMALADMPLLPIYIYTRTWMEKPYVRGIFSNDRDMHPFKYVWIDEDWAPGDPYGADPDNELGFGVWRRGPSDPATWAAQYRPAGTGAAGPGPAKTEEAPR